MFPSCTLDAPGIMSDNICSVVSGRNEDILASFLSQLLTSQRRSLTPRTPDKQEN